MYKGAVFFDYDGTLSEEMKGIYLPTPVTVDAIARLRDNGYLAILSTGRSLCYVPKTNIHFDGFVTSDGACTTVNGERIGTHTFPEPLLTELCAAMRELGMLCVLENQDACFSASLDDAFLLGFLENFCIKTDVFAPLDTCREVHKIMATYPSEAALDRLEAQFHGRITISRHRSYPSVDIDMFGIHKGVGVLDIMKHFHVARTHTYAFGDGENDFGMLETVGHGIAMARHAPCLDRVAERIAPPVECDGVAAVLAELGLIPR